MPTPSPMYRFTGSPHGALHRGFRRFAEELCGTGDRWWEAMVAVEAELRVRTVTDELGRTRALLTFKQPAVDQTSGSKPEHETAVEDADVLVTVLTALGVEQIIAFEKRCVNYRFTAQGRDLLATVVTVPELAERTFLELETLADPSDVDAALHVVRSTLRELGIEDSDLTTQSYTDAVATRRGTAQ
jgi:adenylate cyclase, class 2